MLNFVGVGQILADGGSESGRGVGQNLATNQEDKPVNKPSEKFNEFWNLYPVCKRKGGKSLCRELWRKKQYELVADQIIDHLSMMIESEDWTKQERQFVPAPIVYLNKQAWDGWESNKMPSLLAGGI
jgi:hypothetical protein